MKFSIVACSSVHQHCAKEVCRLHWIVARDVGMSASVTFKQLTNNLTRLATPTSADAFRRCSYASLLLRRRVNCRPPPLVASGPPSSLDVTYRCCRNYVSAIQLISPFIILLIKCFPINNWAFLCPIFSPFFEQSSVHLDTSRTTNCSH